MNVEHKFLLVIISFLFHSLLINGNEMQIERKINFDEGWKFYRGSFANAEQPKFNDSKWRVLDLPHDWSVESVPIQKEGITIGPFSKLNESGAGGADTGQTVGGEGWYRKTFTIEEEDANKLFTLYFEGVYNQSEIFINGKKVYFNPYGYTSYKVDITGFCNAPGEPNTIAVRVINAGENSRWYSGSGIYRHVWLIKTDKMHLDEWDTFVNASELMNKGKEALIKFNTIIHNTKAKSSEAQLNIRIFSPIGNEVYSTNQDVLISSNEVLFSTSFHLKNPSLWSINTPVLYKAEVTLSSDGKVNDRITIPFGIRTIAVSVKDGFQLNGTSMKLKGGCIHHDNGLLGAVAIDRAEERKVELLKANGYNSVRCAHNQVSEYFLNACDRLGLLVIHETFDQWQQAKREQDYHQFFDEWSEKDLIASVRRDRNHPSIIMWSIGNEIAQRADSIGEVIAENLVSTILKYDDSRLSTVGVNDFWDRRHVNFTWDKDAERAFRNVDVAGYNYMWGKYESDHTAHSDRIIYGSESYPKDAALNWNLVEKHPYVIGDFVWTAIDYIGEAGLGHALELEEGEHDSQFMGWPWYNAWCGDIDFCGNKKPQSYYRDILWGEREIVMAVRRPVAEGKKEVVNGWGWTDELLSWTWKGWEAQPMRVNVYSRSSKVRLYLNDKLIGEKETGKENYTATFEVPYEEGVLKAVNVNKNRESSSTLLRTVGEPFAIRLVVDRPEIEANKNDLAYVLIEIIDEKGDVVPDCNLHIDLEVKGNGKIVASGNASPDDMESFRSLSPKVFRGIGMVVMQSDGIAGEIELIVSAKELGSSSVSIRTLNNK